MTVTHTPVRCSCSEMQLDHVGCDCGASRYLRIECRSDSFGQPRGPLYFNCYASEDVTRLAVEKFGMLARVVKIVDLDELQLQNAIAANRAAASGHTYEQLQSAFGGDNS